MKNTALLILTLVMIASIFCGCTTRKNNVVVPTISPIITTSPGQDDLIPGDDVVPDVEDGIVTDDKTDVLPAEGEKNAES